MQRDLVILHQGGWGALRDSIFLTARHHPEGMRLIRLSLALVGLADLTMLRLVALLSIALTAWLTYATARLAAGRTAGMLAAAAFLVTPMTVKAAQDYMSETLLMPALAGLMWALARECRAAPPRGNAVVIGLCIGAGLLARLSFLPQAAPVIAAATLALLLLAPERLSRLLMAALVALLPAWPF